MPVSKELQLSLMLYLPILPIQQLTIDWHQSGLGWHGLVNASVPEATAAWAGIRNYILDKTNIQ